MQGNRASIQPPLPDPQGAARAALAELAFGGLSGSAAPFAGGASVPLALLPADALELDLSDPQQRQFGAYELLERIGEGGMGVVYRARQSGLDREVAIKLLAAGPWASHAFVTRFLDEARHAARMEHPHIVTVYEVGTAEDLHYFSMRLVRGRSLAEALRADGPLQPRHAAILMRSVAEAVAYAHSIGVLHLDLKPANVLLDEDGAPHVADFGLARRFDPLRVLDNTEISGTPSYMAPEQADIGAEPLTPATDIWGLGAILYDLVTGEPPFRGDTAQSTLDLLRGGRVRRPRARRPHLPLDLDAIILRCLEHDPARRYASARGLADDLARFVEGRPVEARPLGTLQRITRWGRREPRLAAALALALSALAAGLVSTTGQWQRAERNALSASANAREASERLWAGRRGAALRLMQDGRGFEALAPLVDNVAEQERAGHHDPLGIERREIGMILAQGPRLIDRVVLAGSTPLASALSADGRLLALAMADASVRWYDTANLAELGRVDVSEVPTSDGATRLPRRLRFIDAHRLAVTLDWFDYLASPASNDTSLVDLDAGRVVELPAAFADPAEAIFSADGRHALLRNRHDEVQLWEVEPWRAAGPLQRKPQSNVWAALLGRGGRYLAEREEDANGFLTLRDPRGGTPPRPVGLRAAPTAWMESHDGRWLAVGDSRGHVHLVDVAAGSSRELATPAGREVTWVAFSEDDAWLAAVRWDGAAFAFNANTGEPLNAGQIQHAFEPREVAIDHASRLLVVAGLGNTALWRLPKESPNPLEATPLIASPTRTERAGTNALGIALGARLLASVSLDGEVRLWRIAPPASVPARASADGQMAGNLHFDGERLVDVAWDRLRIAGIDGAPRTPWRRLPQPPMFAELTARGSLVVAAAGTELNILDGATLADRIAPVTLRATPMHLAVDAAGSRVLLGFGHNTPSGFEVEIESIDAASGVRLGQARVRGPLRQFELSPDGRRLLATGPAEGDTRVLDSGHLGVVGVFPHQRDRPVTWAAFDPDSPLVWLLARERDDSLADDADLLAWDPAAGVVREQRHVEGGFPVGLTVVDGKPLLATRERDLLDAGSPAEVASEGVVHAESSAVFARSHDGRLVAHAIGRDVQLYDAATLEPVGPPLHSDAGPYALPFSLAFAPDDGMLLGGMHPWLLWPIAADARPLETLRAAARLLAPRGGGPHVLDMPDERARAALRGADPGAPPVLETRPTFTAARAVRGLPIPERDPRATPLQLDLTRFYNRPADLRPDIVANVLGGQIGMRFGLARIDGVDYDLRAAVELRRHGSGAFARVAGIAVPDVAIAAFHVLLMAPLATPTSEAWPYAFLVARYADGGVARLPIRTVLDVPGHAGGDEAPPIGWIRSDFLRLIGLTRLQAISNPRLLNPHPERRIVALDLETAQGDWSSPVFFAITAEPVIAGANGGIPLAKRQRTRTDGEHHGKRLPEDRPFPRTPRPGPRRRTRARDRLLQPAGRGPGPARNRPAGRATVGEGARFVLHRLCRDRRGRAAHHQRHGARRRLRNHARAAPGHHLLRQRPVVGACRHPLRVQRVPRLAALPHRGAAAMRERARAGPAPPGVEIPGRRPLPRDVAGLEPRRGMAHRVGRQLPADAGPDVLGAQPRLRVLLQRRGRPAHLAHRAFAGACTPVRFQQLLLPRALQLHLYRKGARHPPQPPPAGAGGRLFLQRALHPARLRHGQEGPGLQPAGTRATDGRTHQCVLVQPRPAGQAQLRGGRPRRRRASRYRLHDLRRLAHAVVGRVGDQLPPRAGTAPGAGLLTAPGTSHTAAGARRHFTRRIR
ncbi:MAG: protein kinase [Xanthomonadales bacterium]|nr:protein kinase [Xanthomonadales bacterium]